MMNLSIQTRLSPKDSLSKIEEYFVKDAGLKLVESVAHMHGKNGSVEIRVYDNPTGERKEQGARDMLMKSAENVQKLYGLTLIYYLYHFHSSHQESIEHLVVTVSSKTPTEINLQSEELDNVVEKFAERIPKT